MSRTELDQLVVDALENDGPMTFGTLREVVTELNGDRYVDHSTLAGALGRLMASGRVEEVEHADARARQGGAPAEYRVKV